MNQSSVVVEASCAVEVFIAAALLHRENPGREEFTIQEIVNRAARENITGELRSGVNVHASQHCVANKAPNPGRHRMLFATGKHTRRLLLPGDETHPGRTGKVFPDPGEVPEKYLSLLAWAKARYENGSADQKGAVDQSVAQGTKLDGTDPKTPERWLESLFELEGLGKQYWKNVDPDEFVRKLREGWE
jgi:hypothetical protein